MVLFSTASLKLAGHDKSKKFYEKFIGPYRIKSVKNKNAYELEIPSTSTLKIHPTVNVSRLKEYHSGIDKFPDRPMKINRPPPVATDLTGDNEWEVENVIGHKWVKLGRARKSTLKYLIKWKGYGYDECTYEPIENLNGCLRLVSNYNQKNNVELGVVTVLSTVTTAEQGKNNNNTQSSHTNNRSAGLYMEPNKNNYCKNNNKYRNNYSYNNKVLVQSASINNNLPLTAGEKQLNQILSNKTTRMIWKKVGG